MPYELRIAPTLREEGAFSSDLLAAALRTAAELVRRLREVEGRAVPSISGSTTDPGGTCTCSPRLTVAAGIELGAGIYVNPLPPEEAARRLRDS